MSGKRNVSVCRGHELANALYMENKRLDLIMVPELIPKLWRNSGQLFTHDAKNK